MRYDRVVFDLPKTASRVAEVLGVKKEDVWARGRYPRIVEARSLLCYWAVRELGQTMSSLSRRLAFDSGREQVGKQRRAVGKVEGLLSGSKLRS